MNFNLNRPVCVVYGEKAAGTEVEAAWYIHQTLEAATGRVTPVYSQQDLPADHPPVIYVGTADTLEKVKFQLGLLSQLPPPARYIAATGPAIAQKDLVIAGATADDAELAAMDFVLRYWKTAKDAACRRIPLTDKPIEKGADPNALP